MEKWRYVNKTERCMYKLAPHCRGLVDHRLQVCPDMAAVVLRSAENLTIVQLVIFTGGGQTCGGGGHVEVLDIIGSQGSPLLLPPLLVPPILRPV